MRTIEKYELKEGENQVMVPSMSEPISAGAVGEKIVVWFEVETDEVEKVGRAFLVTKVGDEIESGMSLVWLGVAVMMDGTAYHISEIL